MKTRNKIIFWSAVLCLVALAALAANPSFADFLTSQFATTTAKSVAIKNGAQFTNIVVQTGAAQTGLTINDTANVGTSFSVFDNNSATVFSVNANGLATKGISIFGVTAGIASITGLGAMKTTADAAGLLVNDGSGGFTWSSSPVNIDWATNAHTGGVTFPVSSGGIYSFTNGSAALSFTGVSGSDTTHARWGVMLIDAAGADRALTLPATWRVPDGNRSITVTNGVVGVLSVTVYANKYTNAFYRAAY